MPKTKPLLSSKQTAARVKWCKQRLFWGQDDWKKILFSDENMFCVPYLNQSIRVKWLKQKTFDKECLKGTVNFTTSVIVEGCMTTKGLSRLCIVCTNVSEERQEILEHCLIHYSEDLWNGDFLFQQDSASFYTSKSTTKWLQENETNVLPWSLGGIMKRKFREISSRHKRDLISSLKNIWANFD